MKLTGNLTHDLKSALDNAMSNAAAHTNRLHSLYALAQSEKLNTGDFMTVIGQHPMTIKRDLENAQAEFQTAKANYELFCERMNLPAYATYNDD